MDLVAPIVAVTVHPDRARVTRRGTVALGAGATELVVAGLPETLLDDSVRVAGRQGLVSQPVIRAMEPHDHRRFWRRERHHYVGVNERAFCFCRCCPMSDGGSVWQ